MPQTKRSAASVFPPGDFIREELETRGWTQSQLAQILGRPTQAVNAIVNGKKEITTSTAVALGAAFGTSAAFWLNLETAYRLAQAGPADPSIAVRARQALSTTWPFRRKRKKTKAKLEANVTWVTTGPARKRSKS
jgi:HTH-type transcriptional regulator / antitoxin HigA